MKYHTDNELQNFRFEGAYIAETCAVNGNFEMILDNVTILPQIRAIVISAKCVQMN